jgi:hypothetical protein
LLLFLGTACAQTPGDVFFELRATRSPAVYQIGERIELELSFSAAVSGKYGIVYTSETSYGGNSSRNKNSADFRCGLSANRTGPAGTSLDRLLKGFLDTAADSRDSRGDSNSTSGFGAE